MAADPLINRTLKHYRIDKLLGQGGMGAVYRATDLQLQRTVAIKLMHPQFATQRDFQERFLQEAQSVARFDHENIIRIFDSELQGTLLYMVTEYVAGGNLREYLKTLYEQRKFIAIPEALTLTRQIADALNYAHAQGIMHRDVKPDNVLLKAAPPGSESAMFRAVLTDFGLAKLAEGGVLSVADSPTGTLPYMSPEQALAEPVDNRTDLYALGVMLYELSTGRLPFMPRSVPEAIKMHTQMTPDVPTKVRPSLSPELERVIMKAMAKNPADRYQTGAEFARALRTLEQGLSSGGNGPAQRVSADEGVGRPDDLPRSGQSVPVPPIEPEASESIGVYLQSMAQGSNAAPAIVAQPNDTPNDRLVISAENEQPRYFPLIKSPVDIGREPQMDLQLVSAKVSRHHARIERRKDGQYTIMDMGSSNGTFLGEAKLLSNIPEVWPADVPVRVGNYWLAVQRAAQTFNTGRVVQQAPPSMVAQGAIPGPGAPVYMNVQAAPQAQTSGIAVTLKPTAITLEAGGRDNIQVEILNQSELVEHYQFEVLNIPREWYTVPMTTLQLMPGGKGSVMIAFHPPRNCKSTAGTHTPSIRIVSQERRKELTQTPASLTINPFYQFEGDMRPRRIRNRGEIQVLITNKGNSTEVYTLAARDREQALHFDPADLPLQIEPCETGKAVFFVRPTRRPLIGFSSKLYAFDVGTLPASGGSVQSLPGEVMTTPSIPWWLLAFLLLLLLLLCLLLYFLIRPQPTVVVTPNNTVTADHGTLEGWLTSTAVGFNGRQTATYTSRNATATQVTNLTATGTANFLATLAAQNAQATNVQATVAQQTQISNFIELTNVAATKTAQAQAEPTPGK